MSDAAAFPVGLPTRLRPRRILGSGSSGTVWLARDTRAGVDVAVKVLAEPVDAASERHLAARLDVEARSLGRLSRVDGVVRILEVGRTPTGSGWIVSEHLCGGTLADRGASVATAVEVRAALRRLAGTLARCHGLGVVHGDLSPSNVLFDERGRPALADFGLAVVGGEEPDVPAGLTPRFASPERRAGGPPSPADDVHALGATMQWWLAGAEQDELLSAALSAATEPLAARRPSAAELLEAVPDRSGGPGG